MSLRAVIKLLVVMALRNLTSHRVKTLIIGGVLSTGAALLVVGMALLDSVEASMARVVTQSLAGHLQVYAEDGRDELALFGSLSGPPELGEIEDFAAVKAALLTHPNVEAVVPMGIGVATGLGGNEADRLVQGLRDAIDAGDQAAIKQGRDAIRQLAEVLLSELDYRAAIASDQAAIKREREVLERVRAEALWQGLDTDPASTLMTLETQLAPLVPDDRAFFVRYLGTDPGAFVERFDSFEVVAGEAIPSGQRGLMFSTRTYEKFLKHQVARELDEIKLAVTSEGRTISDDPRLRGKAERLPRQYRRVLYQLDDQEAAALAKALAPLVPEGDLASQLQAFLQVNDENLMARYDAFYEHIAPKIMLYRVNIGEVVVLRTFTRRGTLVARPVKVWGTFQFKGLEDSELAGVVNLMDLMTFREMYGKMSEGDRAQLATAREQAGVGAALSRDTAEEDLFGADVDEALVEARPDEALGFDEFAGVDLVSQQAKVEDLLRTIYTKEQIERGIALHAAVILKDISDLKGTQRELEALSAREGLGLKVVDWQQASGIVGQLIVVIRVVLLIAVLITFLVALVIINNAMLMATMERVSEVGTMRAIGAQRKLVLGLFVLEGALLGVGSATLGGLMGVGIITVMGQVGLPATNEIMRFVFAGARLYPSVSVQHVGLGALAIVLVSLGASLYPALTATRVQPVVAMRGRD